MNYLTTSRWVLVAALSGVALFATADDLDAALNAQKKKTTHRVYSQTAQIDDLNLQIPTLQTDEEKALDQELKLLEKRLDNQITQPKGGAFHRSPRVVPTQRENWLTPAMADPDENRKEDEPLSWVDLELDRQRGLQLKKQKQIEDTARADKLFKEEARKKILAKESTQLKPYEAALHNTLMPKKTVETPSLTRVSPFSTARPKKPSSSLDTGSRFSLRSPADPKSKWPSTQVKTPQPTLNAPRSPSKVSSANTKKAAPLAPLQRIRKASPIHQKDPFSEDLLRGTKTSIWD